MGGRTKVTSVGRVAKDCSLRGTRGGGKELPSSTKDSERASNLSEENFHGWGRSSACLTRVDGGTAVSSGTTIVLRAPSRALGPLTSRQD